MDIDLVEDIYRVLEVRHAADLQSPELQDDEFLQKRVLEQSPSISLINQHGHVQRRVGVDEIRGLGAHQRTQIYVAGAGVQVDLRRSERLTIATWMVTDDRGQVIQDLIKNSGSRRPNWWRTVHVVPYLLAIAGSASGVWAILVERPSVALTVFVGFLTLAMWGLAIVSSRLIQRRNWDRFVGTRFREDSRAEMRERMLNLRANAMTAAWTLPLGALLGALLGYAIPLWLGG